MTDTNTLAPTDAERLEFEAWLQPYWSRAQRISGDGDSVYIEDWVQGAWVGWSAARRAPAPASSEPVALPAGMEPVALLKFAVWDDGELRLLSGRKGPAFDCELYAMPDGKRAPDLFTAAQVQAMLSHGMEHACNLWVDPKSRNYVVDRCDHPCAELIPAFIAAAPQPAAPNHCEDVLTMVAPSGPARVPLTDEQLVDCINRAGFKTWDSRMWELKRQIEAAHGIEPAP